MIPFHVFDWETTGTDPAKCRGVQFARLSFCPESNSWGQFETLCDPQEEIGAEAEKIHGISRAQLVGKPFDFKVAADFAREAQLKEAMICGHNVIGYDIPVTNRLSAFGGFQQGLHGLKVIDTLVLAVRLWPHAPSHRLSVEDGSVQGLTQWLQLDASKAAHDALNDCMMVAEILERAMAEVPGLDVQAIAEWLATPMVLETCHFKKHRGVPWAEVPSGYISWMVNNFDTPSDDLRATIKHHFNREFRSKR